MTEPAAGLEHAGTLTRIVLEYERTMKRLVPEAKAASDWTPLARFIAVDEFERIGTFLEVQNWQQYAEMLSQWASATDSFETTLHRISELPSRVYFEIEERHFRGGNVNVVNSMTVFEFNEDRKICHLDVYLQMAPPQGAMKPRST